MTNTVVIGVDSDPQTGFRCSLVNDGIARIISRCGMIGNERGGAWVATGVVWFEGVVVGVLSKERWARNT